MQQQQLRLVLLSGVCLCVCGAPAGPRDLTRAPGGGCGGRCAGPLADAGHASSVGARGRAGPHARPGGADAVTQAGNGDGFDGISGPSRRGGGQPEKVGSTSEAASVRSAEAESAMEATSQLDVGVRSPGVIPRGITFPASSTVKPQLSFSATQSKGRGPGEGDSHQPSARSHRLTSQRPHLPSASPLLAIWGSDGATVSPLPDPLLPEIGPNLLLKEDGAESLWTEAARAGGADTGVPLAQDEATEGTMSSEALPLIFEPFDDATPMPAGVRPPAAVATAGLRLSEADLERLVTVETDGGPSPAQPPLMPDWTSPWQTSGAELLDSSASQRHRGTETVAMKKPNLQARLPTAGSSLASLQHALTTVTMATPQPMHKSRSGLEEMESEEDEEEEEENSEESVEDDSDEDLTEAPKAPSTPPPYSFIPPPPVWVQRNQGLMRGWVELIREKAGYVSGMLAPVGIGITGALLIVGALYSIRMIHRKRRNSFKHQRRKVRQPEQPRETSTSRQDQAMLLADSSEDEF